MRSTMQGEAASMHMTNLKNMLYQVIKRNSNSITAQSSEKVQYRYNMTLKKHLQFKDAKLPIVDEESDQLGGGKDQVGSDCYRD